MLSPTPLKLPLKIQDISVTGIISIGGNIQWSNRRLNGFAVSLNMNTPTIIIVHQDIPGMFALVTGTFRYSVNIAR